MSCCFLKHISTHEVMSTDFFNHHSAAANNGWRIDISPCLSFFASRNSVTSNTKSVSAHKITYEHHHEVLLMDIHFSWSEYLVVPEISWLESDCILLIPKFVFLAGISDHYHVEMLGFNFIFVFYRWTI